MKTFKIKTLLVLAAAMSALLIAACSNSPESSSSSTLMDDETIVTGNNVTINDGEAFVYLTEGGTKQLYVKPADTNVIWSSDNESIATVDENGSVTAISSGIATIFAALDSGKVVSIEIVVSVAVTGITIDDVIGGEFMLAEGRGKVLSATVSPSDAGQMVTWSSGNTNIATVDGNGKVTGTGPGTAIITAKSVFDPAIEFSVSVYVEPAAWQTNIGDTVLGRVTLDPGDAYKLAEVSGRGTITTSGQTFNFVYIPAKGDFTMRIKLDSVSHGIGNGSSAVAGLIAIPKGNIVQTNDGALKGVPTSRNLLYASAILRPAGAPDTRQWWHRVRSVLGQNNNELRIADGIANNGATNSQLGNPGRWIKLRREGNLFTASVSLGPDNWHDRSTAITMGDVYAGIWVAAGTSATLNPDPGDVNPASPTGAGYSGTGRTKAGFSDWAIVYGNGDATDSDFQNFGFRISLANFIEE